MKKQNVMKAQIDSANSFPYTVIMCTLSVPLGIAVSDSSIMVALCEMN